jgi:Skp family chaperone for outer membrane proteins
MTGKGRRSAHRFDGETVHQTGFKQTRLDRLNGLWKIRPIRLKSSERSGLETGCRREDHAFSAPDCHQNVQPAQQRSASAVKKIISSASAVAVLAGILSLGNTVWSQSAKPAREAKAAAAESRPHKVGLIDMAYVFKNYKKFEYLREDLKAQIAESELQAKQMAEEIKGLQAEMKELKEGSDQFSAKEKKLAELSAKFETFRRATQREILKEESAIYHTIYMEVADAVKRYSKYYGYTLVLRFNREDLNPEDPQGLIQGMNRQVVFHQQEDDMTDSVLDHLNQKFADTSGASTKPATRPAKEANSSTKSLK